MTMPGGVVGEAEAQPIFADLRREPPQVLAQLRNLSAFSRIIVSQQADRTPVYLQVGRGKGVRRVLALVRAQRVQGARHLNQTLGQPEFAPRAKQIVGADPIDPDAPQMEDTEADDQDDDRPSGKRVRDQPLTVASPSERRDSRRRGPS